MTDKENSNEQNSQMQENQKKHKVNLANLCKRPGLGAKAREMLQPENLIGPFESHEEMMKSLWGDD